MKKKGLFGGENMFGIKLESKSIRKFVDILSQFEKEHPDEICPPATDPQLVVDCLCDVFLGPDWYTTLPMSAGQVNTIILDKILSRYSKEFRKVVKENKRIVRW